MGGAKNEDVGTTHPLFTLILALCEMGRGLESLRVEGVLLTPCKEARHAEELDENG